MVESNLTVSERARREEKAWLPKRERENSMFQRISLSQSLTHYIHSSLSARPWQLHKLAERGFLGKAFDQVCVCLCVCCVSEREERERCTFVHTWTSDVRVYVCVYVRVKKGLFCASDHVGMRWMHTDKTDSVCVGKCWQSGYAFVCVCIYCMTGIVSLSVPCVKCVLSEACYGFHSGDTSLWDAALGILFWIWHFPPNMSPCCFFFQRRSVNKPIVKRLASNQPSAQFGLWSREVFIIMITDATWNAHASRCMSHTAGHWVAPLEEFGVGSFAQCVCFLTNEYLFLIRIQLHNLNDHLFLPLLALIIWTHCNYFLWKCWFL